MKRGLAGWIGACRRLRTRWFGSGPYRTLPIVELLRSRHPLGAWHESETVDGEIVHIRHPALHFEVCDSLLGRTPIPYMIDPGLPRFRMAGILPAEKSQIWSLGPAGIIGEDGLVYCPHSRTAIAETARSIYHKPEDHPALGMSRPLTGRLDGVSLLLASPFGRAHYHLLWDNLAKVGLLPPTIRSRIDHFLLGATRSATTNGWLQAAGIPLDRVVWLQGDTHLECRQLLFGTMPNATSQVKPAILEALRDLLRPPRLPGAGRWLWISRRGSPVRDLHWEDRILHAFPQFERLDLNQLEAQEQVRAFAEAAVVAGPHGSGFANLAFVNGTGDVVELWPHDSPIDPLYGRIAQLAGWRHAWAQVDFATPSASEPLINALGAHLPNR